eukprot:6451800-Alexandrium_andersonii.AAC.1
MPNRRSQHDDASPLGGRCADPRLLAELLHVRWRLTRCVPDARLAQVDLHSGVALQRAGEHSENLGGPIRLAEDMCSGR